MPGITIGSLVALFEHAESVEQYVDEVYRQCGIRYTPAGKMILEEKEAKINPRMFSFTDLCEAFCGRSYLAKLRSAPNGMRGGKAVTVGAMEAIGGGALGPSMFQNINAWLGTVGGLLGATMLEGYNSQEFIGDKFCTIKTGSRFRGAKRIRYTPIKDRVKALQPGQEVPTAEIDEKWIRETIPVRRGQAIELSREAIHHDFTDSLVDSARDQGYQIREDREERELRPAFGITNDYQRNDQAYRTYQLTTPYVNLVPNNELVDERNVDTVWQTLTRMVDPDTGRPISFPGELILITTAHKRFVASRIARATTFRNMGPTTATSEALYVGRDPVLEFTPLWSQRASYLLTQSYTDERGNAYTGISQAQADNYWVLLTKGAFEYVEQWPFTMDTYSWTDNASLGSRGVLLRTQGEEYGETSVLEPRRTVMSFLN